MILALLLAASTSLNPIDLEKAQRAFEEVRLAAEEDGGRLWGVPLYGPILFVDRATRFAVANQADAAGVLKPDGRLFTGTLPPDVILANTATTWSGTEWTMVLWDSVAARTVSRRRLLFHETWHRIQDDLGFAATDAPVNELDSAEGRIWLRLELRALAAALRASNEERTPAIRDALTFRAKRRALFKEAAARERALELNEGLAEYTGFALRGTSDFESRIALAERITAVDPQSSFVRSFAYETGPAYGLLLDALSAGWTRKLKRDDDLGALLAAAARVEPNLGEAAAAAARHRGDEVRSFETAREKARVERTARYRAMFVEGPVVELPMANARYGFDPNTVVPLENAGSVHPALEVTADWGTLSAKGGALITSDFTRIVLPAGGKDWTLDLKPGWKMVPGARPDDRRVVRSE